PRESGRPESAPGLNRVQPPRPCNPGFPLSRRAVRGIETGCAYSYSHNVGSPWPGLAHGCPVEQLGQCGIERRELQCNCKYPLPGLVPGTHVLTAEITKAQEDVDGRVKPGQGDRRLCMDRWRQPVSLNRTAVGQTRPRADRALCGE